ncbi:hypothetical protein [Mycobacterium colombiense]|nr:hypothetical protein [Mycobacterium colombiense]
MSFVTANRWSQASTGRWTTADQRIVDASTIASSSSAVGAASARQPVTV